MSAWETTKNIIHLVAWSVAIAIAFGLLLALLNVLWFITIPLACLLLIPGLSRRINQFFLGTVKTLRHAWHESSPRTKEERRRHTEVMEPMVYQRPVNVGPDRAIVDCPDCDEGFTVITKDGDVHQPCPRCNAADVDEHSRTPRHRQG